MRPCKPLEKAIIKSLLDYTREDGYVLVNELLSKRFYTSPRTTLTEKIKPLIREGLVQQIWVEGQHGKRRAYRLTPSIDTANTLKEAGIDIDDSCFYRNSQQI